MNAKLKLSTNSRNLPQLLLNDKIVFNRCIGYCKPGEVYEVSAIQNNSGDRITHDSIIHLKGAFGSTQIKGYDLVFVRIVELEGVN